MSFSSVLELISDSGNPRLYDDAVRVMLENYLPQIRAASTTKVIDVDPHDADVYDGDLAGYLFNVAQQAFDIHDLIMRMNYMSAPTDFGRNVTRMLIPDRTDISRLSQALTSKVNTA